jgi:hypothetical protein
MACAGGVQVGLRDSPLTGSLTRSTAQGEPSTAPTPQHPARRRMRTCGHARRSASVERGCGYGRDAKTAGVGARSAAAGGSFFASEPFATQKQVEGDRAATIEAGRAGG